MPDEAQSPTRHFAASVKRHRALKGWTQPQLAEQCRAVGLEWDRSIVANVEAGRRASVSLQEVLTLAFVFDVPPTLMIFPVGMVEETEVLPNRVMDTWEAARWLSGEGYPPRDLRSPRDLHDDEFDDPYVRARVPVYLFRLHTQQVAAYERVVDEMEQSPVFTTDTDELPDEHVAKVRGVQSQGYQLRDETVEMLRATRAEIRRHGLRPPALPPGLGHVDDRRYTFLTPAEAAELRARGVPVRPFTDPRSGDSDGSQA